MKQVILKSITLRDWKSLNVSVDFSMDGVTTIEGRNGISGRKKALASSLYNKENSYGSTSVDTTANVNDGQYFFGQNISKTNA